MNWFKNYQNQFQLQSYLYIFYIKPINSQISYCNSKNTDVQIPHYFLLLNNLPKYHKYKLPAILSKSWTRLFRWWATPWYILSWTTSQMSQLQTPRNKQPRLSFPGQPPRYLTWNIQRIPVVSILWTTYSIFMVPLWTTRTVSYKDEQPVCLWFFE